MRKGSRVVFERGLLTMLIAAGAAAARGQPLPPTQVAEAEKAMVVIRRWLNVQGLDRPPAEVFPRASMHELVIGDAPRGLKIRFVDTSTGDYRLVVERENGTRYGEIREGFTTWHLDEELGNGKLPAASPWIELLRHGRLDEKTLRQRYRSWKRYPDEQREGRKYHVVGMQPANGVWEYWVFEAERGVLLVVATLSNTGAVIGRVRFDDFRMTGGALEPYSMVTGEGPQRVTLRTEKVELRAAVPHRFFSPTKAEHEDWQRTEDILAKYVQACGGRLALAQIVTRVTKSVGENLTTGVKFRVTLSEKSPSSYLAETVAEGIGRSWVGFDGETAWELSELKGFRAIKGAEIELYRRNGRLNTEDFPRLYPLRRLVGDGTLKGREVTAVELASLHGKAGVHYFDRESGQLVRVESIIAAGSEGALPVTIDFADFRVVDGITIPFETTINNPALNVVTKVELVQHNVELPATVFQPRKED